MTFLTRPSLAPDCLDGSDIPREYIVFADVEEGVIKANSVAVWDETTDQRVWTALGKYKQVELMLLN